MAMTEQPKRPGFGEFIYDKLFHNYIWSSIFRSGYPNTPRNQMLAVATNVFLHLHPTRIHKTHVKITHTYCLGGQSRFVLIGGVEIGPSALIRFYTLHVIALPLLAAIFMSVHFWRIRRDGGLARPL